MDANIATRPFTDGIQIPNLPIDKQHDMFVAPIPLQIIPCEHPLAANGAGGTQGPFTSNEVRHPITHIDASPGPNTPFTEMHPDLAQTTPPVFKMKLVSPPEGELPHTAPVIIAPTVPQTDGASPSPSPQNPQPPPRQATTANPPIPPPNHRPFKGQKLRQLGAGSSARPHPIITNAMAAAAENVSWLDEIPSVPVYTPTAAEWADPIEYIRSIQAEAGKYGACVVKAPVAPAVPAAVMLKELRFTTRLQYLKDTPWGKTWDEGSKYYERGRICTLTDYSKAADEFARKKLGMAAEVPTRTAEALYWKERQGRPGKECTVEYGNDIEGTAFYPGDSLGQSNWNLNVS